MKLDRVLLSLAAPALAIALALAVSTAVLVLSGNSPAEVFSLLGDQTTQLGEIVKTINRAGPYYISAVAVAIGFKMKLFNIGVEGQYRLAGVVAAGLGFALPLPSYLRLVGILAIAVLVGSAWAGLAGALRAYRGVSEVIATIMLNAIALGLTAFLLTRYFKDESEAAQVDFATRTGRIPQGGRMPDLDWLIPGEVPGGVSLNAFILLAVAVGVGYWLLIWRSRFGYDLRASGANPWAARASGVDAKRMTVLAMVISGGVAGLVGLSSIVGSAPYSYTEESFLAGLGFTGIAIALLGRNNPVGIAFGALLWSFMDIAKTPLSRADLPREITTIMQGVIVLSVVIAYQVVERVSERREAAITAQATDPDPPGDDAPAPSGVTA
ncbi:ABC transporter permease [Iamia majanohamensis]|uniref:ABC transporter permease n=1 Tax=Iamia majanohamensis TaxID=467976 RepID=A0AAF0BSQ5_9ACTN|nr:ABC transporter permease [Iamia majanohamensis]WCO68706.1 ABC transporter permease [Iamia majanohamensis]